MTRWVVLLRAVNVGGTAKLPMEEFGTALESEGFTKVESYIASGNIALESDQDAEFIRTRIDTLLNTTFKLSGERSLLRDAATLDRLIKQNPFPSAAANNSSFLHVHFLKHAATAQAELNLTSYKGPERLRLHGDHLFIDYPGGAGQSALTARFLETALGTTGTARNWNTVLKLAEMARGN